MKVVVTRWLCALLGGHDYGLPRVIDGRLRLACQHGCGAMTTGITTVGMDQAAAVPRVTFAHLRMVVRSEKRRVA